MDQMKYLKELAVRYPNVAAASTEIINLQAILHYQRILFLNGSMIRWYVWFTLQDLLETNIQDQK